MAGHFLVPSDSQKIQCEDDLTCDKVKLDISETGVLSYYLVVIGGPSNNKQSGIRYIRICNP